MSDAPQGPDLRITYACYATPLCLHDHLGPPLPGYESIYAARCTTCGYDLHQCLVETVDGVMRYRPIKVASRKTRRR